MNMRRKGRGAPDSLRRAVLLAGTLLLVGLVGCGADPGGDFLDDGFTQDGLPIGTIQEKIVSAYEALAANSLTQARNSFLTIIGDGPSDANKSQAWAGIGFVDARNLGTAEAITEFQTAYDLDNTNPDARVGLAGALISRGTAADIDEAINLLEGLDTGNPSFTYTDRYKLGISNAEVHAMLAYALRVDGQVQASNTQRDIAQNLDANVDDTTVDQILDVLAFLP